MRYLHNILFLVILICFSACRKVFDEDIYAENYGIELYAGAGPNLVVKGTEPYQFKEGTLFHIYGTRPGSGSDVPDNWDVNYMTDKSVTSAGVVRGMATTDLDGTKRKIVSKEGETGISSVFRTEPMNLYGVTVVCIDNHAIEEDEDQIAHHNAQLEQFLTEGDPVDNIPHYKVSYSDRTQQMPDVMWSTVKGLTPKNNSGKLAMPFKHTMTRLNFVAVQGADLDPTIEKMEIKSLVVKDYHDGILHMENGLYTHTAPADRREWMTSPSISFNDNEEVEVMKGQENPFGSCIIFPTNGANYDDPFGGESNTAVIDDKDAVYVRLTVLLTRKDDQGNIKPEKETLVFDKVKLTHYERPAVFHPNCEYVITFSLTTSQTIVTLRPEYYEYIEEYVPLDPESVGEPIDFGGVLWAASNLGASSANPIKNALEWEKSRGFYYQFGRNIPYYVRCSMEDPYPEIATYAESGTGIDSKTYKWDYEHVKYLYTDKAGNWRIPNGATSDGYGLEGINNEGQSNPDLHHGARAYPYIPILWEHEIEMAIGSKQIPTRADTVAGYKSFLKKTRLYSVTENGEACDNGQVKPAKNNSDPIEAYKDIDTGELSNSAYTCFYLGNGGWGKDRFWKEGITSATDNWDKVGDNCSDPCPKGWRLPTIDEFMSVIPSSEFTGNITFRDKSTIDNGKIPSNLTYAEDIAGLYRVLEKKDYNGQKAFYLGLKNDGEGFSDIGEVTVFIDGKNQNYPQGWGTIYAIKQFGTKNAYGVRWQLKTIDYDFETGGRDNNVESVQELLKGNPKAGRGVLVVSKYDLTDNYDKTKYCLDYDNGKCVCFEDADDNKNIDNNEKVIDVDWDNPSGIFYLPVSGYVIVPSASANFGQALIYPGTEALYWSSTKNPNGKKVQCIRIKHIGDPKSRAVYVNTVEESSNGANIRCVRDVEAVN